MQAVAAALALHAGTEAIEIASQEFQEYLDEAKENRVLLFRNDTSEG